MHLLSHFLSNWENISCRFCFWHFTENFFFLLIPKNIRLILIPEKGTSFGKRSGTLSDHISCIMFLNSTVLKFQGDFIWVKHPKPASASLIFVYLNNLHVCTEFMVCYRVHCFVFWSVVQLLKLFYTKKKVDYALSLFICWYKRTWKNYAKNFVRSSRSVMFYTQDSPLLLEFERELRNIFLNHVHSH